MDAYFYWLLPFVLVLCALAAIFMLIIGKQSFNVSVRGLGVSLSIKRGTATETNQKPLE